MLQQVRRSSVLVRTLVCAWGTVCSSALAGEGKDIELRHQRNPDVLFDCVRQEPGGTRVVLSQHAGLPVLAWTCPLEGQLHVKLG